VDKVTFDERVKWVDEHEAYILDSATNPLDGFRFWADTDEAPYQFLAACFEYARYKEQGADIISHLPIALDGTCNGLQNFSALLRDEIGGKATNLVPQDKPADIYAEVAKIVSKMVERDADAGDEQAHIWVGKVNRKITKRGVMTTPYGAKFYGLKDQLINELKKLDTPTAKYLESTDNYKPCQYLAEKLYDAIGQVVVAARQAMDWLQIVAKVCSQANIPIEWTTPSGFRPHQEYLIAETDIVKTIFGGVQLKVRLARDTIMINKSKQASGISPNYIHSLDASHLVLTINKCLENGIHNFSMIHDSYGTHACDIDKLAHLLRDAFIEQYSEDLLAKLRDEIMAQLPEKSKGKIPPLPKKGGLDLEVIRESRYFFA
jgi:DNA-directed RNA polymerase